jgi:hypothetical protein
VSPVSPKWGPEERNRARGPGRRSPAESRERRRCSVKLAKRITVAVASLLTLVLAGGAHIKL